MRRTAHFLLVLLLGLSVAAQTKSAKTKSSSVPDKTLMQQIWDGWSTRDPQNVSKFYAKGPHVFFDITPLKYDGWDQYESGVKAVLAGFSSLKCTVNNDAQIHLHGNLVWGTATVHVVEVKPGEAQGEGDFRWTVLWEKQGGQWLIVHEHVSEPSAGGPPPEKKQ